MSELRYRAFVSFNHAADEQVAAALQSSLSRFAKPWWRLRSMRVFRDKTGLAATPALWNAIETALSESDYLLLLASTGSAAAPWVQQEVRWWLSNRRADKLILCLTDGVIAWDRRSGDFDWQRTTALSPALKGAFPIEPLYADFSAAKASGQLTDKNPQFRDALLNVASPLLGRPKDDLDGEDIRQHRVAVRSAWAAATVMLILTGIASLAMILSHQRELIAESRALASAAATPLADRTLSLLLAIESHALADTVESKRSLQSALQRLPSAQSFLWGHSQPVTKALFSPDGRLILSAGWDDRLILWDAATHRPSGEPLATVKGLVGIAFDASGARFASASGDRIVLWDTQSRKAMDEPFTAPDAFVHVSLSGSGKFLAGSTDATGVRAAQVYIWDIASHRQFAEPVPGSNVLFSPDERYLAIARFNDLILYDLQSRKEIRLPSSPDKNIATLAFSEDGSLLAASAEDRSIHVWDVKGRRSLGVLNGHESTVSALKFDADGGRLYSGSWDGTVKQWDLEHFALLDTPIKGFGASISSIYLNADGEVKGLALENSRVVMLDVNGDPALGHRIPAPGSGASNLAFSPDGRLLASSAEFGAVSIWDVRSGHVSGAALSGHERQVSSLAFAPDGHVLVSGSMDGSLIFWNVDTHRALGPPVRTDRAPVWGLTCSPDGKWAVEGGDAKLVFWDLQQRRPAPSPEAPKDRIWSVVFNPRGDLFAAAGNKLQTTVWRTGDWAKPLKVLGTAASGDEFEVLRSTASFDADGTLLAMSSAGHSVSLWKLNSDRPEAPVLYGHTEAVSSVAFNNDDDLLATAGEDGEIRLWDVATREPIGILDSHQKPIRSIAFQPGAPLLAAVSEEDVITFYAVGVQEWITRACRIANRNLTLREWGIYFGRIPYRKTCPDLEGGAPSA